MEEQRFDELTKSLAYPVSRRQILKVLAGAAIGGLFASRLSPVLADNQNGNSQGGDNQDGNSQGGNSHGRCPTGQVACNYAPCPADNFAGGTLCCGTGETCGPDLSFTFPGSFCSGTTTDCPPGTVLYNGQCFFPACGGG